MTLFASGESQTSASLVPVIPRALRLGRPRQDPAACYAALLAQLSERAGDFDVIHCHADWLPLPILRQQKTPYLTTLHGRIDLPGLENVLQHFPGAPFVSISDNQRLPLAGLNWLGTVYHGMPQHDLQPRSEPGSYLAFLGRLAPEKGAHVAIELARRTGLPLRVKEQLLPQVDDQLIRLTGEVDDRHKAEFLANASALLFPIDWPEPFGLVIIEAMACGTPVIAFRRGSVPEVIEHGVTGFVVETEDEARQAIARIGQLDRRRVRAEFERRFTVRRMTADYLEHYAALVGDRAHRSKAIAAVPAGISN